VSVFTRLCAVAVCAATLAACGHHAASLHSVRDVQAAFARHGVRLAVFERDRVSTLLLPAAVVREWHRAPALGRPGRRAGFLVAVFTDRRRLQNLDRHVREAERAVGGGGDFRLSRVSTRRDNVFIVYPAGAPKNLERLRRILDDV
jgi:hypothetical protein